MHLSLVRSEEIQSSRGGLQLKGKQDVARRHVIEILLQLSFHHAIAHSIEFFRSLSYLHMFCHRIRFVSQACDLVKALVWEPSLCEKEQVDHIISCVLARIPSKKIEMIQITFGIGLPKNTSHIQQNASLATQPLEEVAQDGWTSHPRGRRCDQHTSTHSLG